MKRKTILPILISAALIIGSLSGCKKAEPFDFRIIDASSAAEFDIRADIDRKTPLDGFGRGISGSVLVYTGDGRILDADASDVTLLPSGGVAVAGEKYEKLVGVMDNADGLRRISDVYTLTVQALDRGERMMVVYLDGFGWQTYEKALSGRLMPVLDSLFCEKAVNVMPTITPVNYAAMVTGKTPFENGVTYRGIHQTETETMFDYCLALGLKPYVVESSTQILAFTCGQELCTDFDGVCGTDNEVTEAALQAMDRESPDLLFVHLHGIDDVSHEYSPQSEELLQKLRETDGYLASLLGTWDGRVIICADHGLHENDGTGDPAYADRRGVHGDFAVSDIFTPIFTN